MSYILDALRRAQAERGRGTVPGLHTPAVSVSSPGESSDSGRPRSGGSGPWWIAAVAALVALVAIVMAWLQFSSKAHQPVVVAQAPVAAAAPEAVIAAEPPPAPAPAATSASKPALVEIDVTPPPPPPKPAVQAAPAAPSAPAKREEAARSAPAKAAAPNEAAPAPTPASASKSAPVYNVANLPSAVREQLPNLQLAGITYSTNAKYRMVIVNGQVLHEGDSAGPGLVLERIENARTIWAFRGYRYALP